MRERSAICGGITEGRGRDNAAGPTNTKLCYRRVVIPDLFFSRARFGAGQKNRRFFSLSNGSPR